MPLLAQQVNLSFYIRSGNYVTNTMSDRDEGDVYAVMEIEDGMNDLEQWNEEYWSIDSTCMDCN